MLSPSISLHRNSNAPEWGSALLSGWQHMLPPLVTELALHTLSSFLLDVTGPPLISDETGIQEASMTCVEAASGCIPAAWLLAAWLVYAPK